MKKRQWYKPWYIWLGPFAFLILIYLSLHTIDKYETKLKIGYPNQRALARKVWGSFIFFGVVVMGVPTAIITSLVGWIFGTTENFLLDNWFIVYLYPASVYANHRHVLWRDENISHLMKAKWNEK